MRHALPTCCVETRWFAAYLSAYENDMASFYEASEETPMLYIFKNNDSVQIAWNSSLPRRDRQTRAMELDTRFSLLGFIRTFSAG